jgi:hypothetical protein
MKIRPIHPFGPAVGKWKSHGTVAETFARIRREQQQAKPPVTDFTGKYAIAQLRKRS